MMIRCKELLVEFYAVCIKSEITGTANEADIVAIWISAERREYISDVKVLASCHSQPFNSQEALHQLSEHEL